MEAYTTQTTWDTYSCPDCTASLPTLNALQAHYTTHDPNWTAGYPSQCEHCGTTHKRNKFHYERAERHFCKNDCYLNWQDKVDDTSRENTNVTAGNTIETECAYCGSRITREKYKIERADRHFCNNTTCQGKYRAEHFNGQDHPDWIGGTSMYSAVSTLLADTPWETIAERVRENNPNCELCGRSDGEGRGHQNHAHHIVPVLAGGVHAPELLMTLCPSCHRSVEKYTETIPGMERIMLPEHHPHPEKPE